MIGEGRGHACSGCDQVERGRWAKRVCRIQQNHRTVCQRPSGIRLHFATHRISSLLAAVWNCAIALGSVVPASRSSQPASQNAAWSATADDARPGHSSRSDPSPSRGRIAEVSIEKVVAGHRGKACIDLALLADANLVNSRSHIVVDAAARHAAKHPERMMMRVEQHLVRLQRIGPDNEGAAVAKLEVRSLQLGPFAAE